MSGKLLCSAIQYWIHIIIIPETIYTIVSAHLCGDINILASSLLNHTSAFLCLYWAMYWPTLLQLICYINHVRLYAYLYYVTNVTLMELIASYGSFYYIIISKTKN